MNIKRITLMSAILLVSNIVFAQAVTPDSINVLKNDNKMLKIAISINEKKIELAKLQNQLSQKNSDVETTAKASQKAADNNQNSANILTNDDQDKDKANTAKKSARDAEKSSSKARNAQDKLTDLNKDIEKIKKEIDENEQKLISMGGSRYLHPAN
ncbi:MAG: hypothetical protein ABIS01_13910 [Ferruginibacter sp.]